MATSSLPYSLVEVKKPLSLFWEKGEFFGEACLTGQLVRTITATALADSTIMRVDKDAMIRVLHDEPTLTDFFMSHLLSR
ncbi:MAG: hypothetical protein WBK08_15275, partial [Nitrospira sp.]